MLNDVIKLRIRDPPVRFDDGDPVWPSCCLATHEVTDTLDGWDGGPLGLKSVSSIPASGASFCMTLRASRVLAAAVTQPPPHQRVPLPQFRSSAREVRVPSRR